MIYNPTEMHGYAKLAARDGPAIAGAWLKAALGRFWPGLATTPPPRDRVREAAAVRAWAETFRQTDPRFAADLFAAADRHELLGP